MIKLKFFGMIVKGPKKNMFLFISILVSPHKNFTASYYPIMAFLFFFNKNNIVLELHIPHWSHIHEYKYELNLLFYPTGQLHVVDRIYEWTNVKWKLAGGRRFRNPCGPR